MSETAGPWTVDASDRERAPLFYRLDEHDQRVMELWKHEGLWWFQARGNRSNRSTLSQAAHAANALLDNAGFILEGPTLPTFPLEPTEGDAAARARLEREVKALQEALDKATRPSVVDGEKLMRGLAAAASDDPEGFWSQLTPAARLALARTCPVVEPYMKRTVWYYYKPGEERDYVTTTTPSPATALSLEKEGLKLAMFEIERPCSENTYLGRVRIPSVD